MKHIKLFLAIFSILVFTSGCTSRFDIRKINSILKDNGEIEINFECDRDLKELEQSRLVQFRCEFMPDNNPQNTVMSFGRIKGIHNELDSSANLDSPKGKYIYTAIVKTDNLMGHNVGYDIIEQGFFRFYCYVIGVMKAPVPFPTSNYIAVFPEELGINNTHKELKK